MKSTCCLILVAMLATGSLAAATPPASGFQEQAALFGQKCAKCHTIGKGDRVGPDLKGVTKRRERDWLLGFIVSPGQYLDSDPVAREMLDKYGGVRMDETGMSRAQAEKLLPYLEMMSESAAPARPLAGTRAPRDPGAGVAGPDEGRGWSWLGILLCLGGLGCAVLTCRRGKHAVAAGLVLVSLAGLYVSAGGRGYHRLLGNDQGYEPAQPIAYSHALHAGKLEITCLYCHHNAEKGPVAGVPSLEICMNCHNRVKNVAGSTKPSAEIAKIAQAWADREKPDAKPVAWTRVHRLPAFAAFDHRAHVKNGIACQECHGPVQTMDVVRQASSLSMGFCVNCHRRVGTDVPPTWKRAPASVDCNACHQ